LALLACLGFAVFRFNAIRQQSCLSAPNSPSLASVPARALLELRANLASVMSGADGQAYASGPVPVQAVWTDNPPEGRSLELSKDGLGPASDEIREWAPDPMWGPAYRDDIAADVFRFDAASQARRFFDVATSVRCHRSGAERPASRPPQARNLIWVNPDAVTEQDVFLLRGPLVYRIVDVRPGASRPSRLVTERLVAVSTVDRLACTIPEADCPRMSAAQRFAEEANDAVCALNAELVSEDHEDTPFILFPIYPRTRAIVAKSVRRLKAVTPPPERAAAYAAFTADLGRLLAIGNEANAARAAHDFALVNRYYYEQAPTYQRDFVSLGQTLGLTECTPVKPA